MSPLRWDVLAVGLLLALPLLALGLRGDLSLDEVAVRLPWCLLAAWAAVALLRWAGAPRRPPAPADADPERATPPA
ncbi:hypothetical protein [Geodermatophilus sp. CPCC 206100]|uniref:hypothetical protein n=1 Tax=Geodermatophilus sp. CPCC 206100 TaxID=3020054 RepID=UPI003B00977E